jgi:hypothetical protein
MTKMYMSKHFDSWQVGNDPDLGVVESKLFLPNAFQHENKGRTYGSF